MKQTEDRNEDKHVEKQKQAHNYNNIDMLLEKVSQKYTEFI